MNIEINIDLMIAISASLLFIITIAWCFIQLEDQVKLQFALEVIERTTTELITTLKKAKREKDWIKFFGIFPPEWIKKERERRLANAMINLAYSFENSASAVQELQVGLSRFGHHLK